MPTKISTAIVLLLSLTALQVEASLTSDGGITGGGGNVINPRAPTHHQRISDVRAQMQSASLQLKEHLLKKAELLKQGQLNDQTAPLYLQLFSAQPNIFDNLNAVPHEIESKHACEDRSGHPVDGSIAEDGGSAVCISAYNLARKVRMQDILAQTTALHGHEYFELTGLNEDEAVILQTAILAELLPKETE